MGPTMTTFNSVQVISSELQNFLPAYDATFMGILTKLYDCELYEERRRTGKVQHTKIDSTQVSILAGTTPSYLNSLFQESAWDQGFMSRTILVHSNETSNVDLFDEPDREHYEQLYEDLMNDLRVMMKYFTRLTWSEDAQKAITDWDNGGRKPAPIHNRLKHYNTRRTAHMVKLSMVACLARGDTQHVVMAHDFETALDWLLEAEATVPDIFKSMIITAEARIMQDAHFHLMQIHASIKKPVPEHYLISFLRDRVPSHSITKIIETMVKSKMLENSYNSPIPCYTPISPNQR